MIQYDPYSFSECQKHSGTLVYPTITQAFGDMVTWQSVNAYNASIVLSGDTSG